jgi:DnaJ-class molecular chaperone
LAAAFPTAGRAELLLEDALALFKRLGVDVRSISAREFTSAYFALAKRYHPDRGNQQTQELMANINAARTTILKCHRMG